jgi:quinol monooxygenase YgiN
MPKIALNVVFEAVPGREADLAAQLQAMVVPSRGEPGCLEYHLNASEDKPGTFLFYEVFADHVALDTHLAMDYVKTFATSRETNDPVASVTVTRWTPLT